MIALGLLILVAAGVVGAVGVFGNDGTANALAQPFEVLGLEFTGSSGVLFFYGMLVGVAAMIGVGMMLAGSRRRVRRGLEHRRERRDIRGEAESLQEERDRLARELEEERERHAADVAVSDPDRGFLLPGERREPLTSDPVTREPAATPRTGDRS